LENMGDVTHGDVGIQEIHLGILKPNDKVLGSQPGRVASESAAPCLRSLGKQRGGSLL
jgi:hypothetical protein